MTLYFLWDGIPSLATVIPTMGHIDNVLMANAVDQHLSPPIWATLTMGQQTLNCYYTKTSMSNVYLIAMGV